MSDRLDDIWGRFRRGTSAKLTGASIDHTVRPSQADHSRYQPPAEAALRAAALLAEADTPDPVEAAITAMRNSTSAGKGRGRKTAPLMASPESLIEAQVLRDMKATERRVRRREGDYLGYAAERQASFRKRKRFLGLF